MAKESSQKFVARNRAPRVQIQYDVELYGSKTTVNLPFVMGVMADLNGSTNGKPIPPPQPVGEREFFEIDAGGFDAKLKSINPKVSFPVDNKITGEGKLQIELSFESMEDFSPAAIANQIDPLSKLLKARQQLDNLMTYMDGKDKAEELIAQAIKDEALLRALISAPKSAEQITESQEE